ncbi:MAG: ATP-binding protein [Desulfofustis sp. PB-SRB1]|mgnify:CR=1 FL=1|jgi:predicted AAA+ superfamily ATPase|nr:ATP-binding protein [Desulfofustis sp. PB-SRB1]MBM1001762.1 ATP-binding protein [Desulfofustis sp. PB-SRB1]HBH29131.1 ATP-binding protein [Desulfofustis sp.]HBH32580.1 ATP-binding protein [Desulfofustis sp.]
MNGYVRRLAEEKINRALLRAPAVALLGPRQCGKSTTAKFLLKKSDSVYLDLQNRVDRNKLTEPELFFERYRNKIICLDEIQLIPEFFSVLRSEIDKDRRPGRFLIMGSASRDLLQQSTESLAGRLAYIDLTPFLLKEAADIKSWDDIWLRGGFPESVLAGNDLDSFEWRLDFIRTFMERDIPSLGFNIPTPVIERLWVLLAHYHGQTVNYHKLAAAVDISIPTLKKYLAILEKTYMIRILPPAETNLKKRLIKSPKVYLRDSGILHALRDIEEYDSLLANPVAGSSWEGFVIENIIAEYDRWHPSFIRTSNGAEVDLMLERAGKRHLLECKLSKAPKPSRGFYELVSDIRPEQAWIVAPVNEPYEIKKGITVSPPQDVRF